MYIVLQKINAMIYNSDNTPPLLSWRKKPAAVTGKRVKFRWKSNEIADFYCAHEKINDLKRCGNASLKGNWIEENLPEGKHLFWVLGVDDVGNRGKPLAHEWVVGMLWLSNTYTNLYKNIKSNTSQQTCGLTVCT